MEKLSVVIITYNEEKNIGQCIDSVKNIADEIIVLDSYSTDNTVQIARQKKARVYQDIFNGYVSQKNKALSLCTYDHVLSLDGDEALDDELQGNILAVKNTFTSAGYSMNRCTNYCGQFIRFGSWYPDKKIRLFKKKQACWGGLDPHDKIVLPARAAVTHLGGNILHYSYSSVKDHTEQNERFSTIAAKSNFEAGKRTSFLKILINPAWALLHDYIIRLGFLNGTKGITVATKQASYTYLKHKKLYHLQKKPITAKVITVRAVTEDRKLVVWPEGSNKRKSMPEHRAIKS